MGAHDRDCLHNARTALNYLMVRLFSLVTENKPRLIGKVEFPIFDDPARFDPKSGSTAPAVIEMRKHTAFSGYLARIEELQPFNFGNPPSGAPCPTPDPATRSFPDPSSMNCRRLSAP